jgi:hypothetical protein
MPKGTVVQGESRGRKRPRKLLGVSKDDAKLPYKPTPADDEALKVYRAAQAKR